MTLYSKCPRRQRRHKHASADGLQAAAARQPRDRKRAAAAAPRCKQEARHPSARTLLPRPKHGANGRQRRLFAPGVRCVAVALPRQRSRERDTRKAHRHCFLTQRGGQTGANGTRLLPPLRALPEATHVTVFLPATYLTAFCRQRTFARQSC